MLTAAMGLNGLSFLLWFTVQVVQVKSY